MIEVPGTPWGSLAPDSHVHRQGALHSAKQRPLAIGLLNNMPDTAWPTTERQFRNLLLRAAGNTPLQFRVFRPSERHLLPDAKPDLVPCEPIGHLWEAALDGLIVTGTEPQSSRLFEEPCWDLLWRLFDWAENNTVSSIWSCLAAHAAVYRLDRIERRQLEKKVFGIFDCDEADGENAIDSVSSRWPVPHSRYNDLPEAALVSSNYRILRRSAVAGVDTFTKQGKSLHFFLQGHLEYDADTLAREYRRDVKRFLAGERDLYPELPCAYFPKHVAEALDRFREKSHRSRIVATLADYPMEAAGTDLQARWRAVALEFYRAWLSRLMSRNNRDAHVCGESNL